MNSSTPNLLINFIRTSVSEQSQFLKTRGILLDTDVHNGEQINLYFLDGFFAEEVMSEKTREVKEIIPFKKGYRVSQFIKSESDQELRSMLSQGYRPS